jgi:hypothetical protein
VGFFGITGRGFMKESFDDIKHLNYSFWQPSKICGLPLGVNLLYELAPLPGAGAGAAKLSLIFLPRPIFHSQPLAGCKLT